MHRQIAPRLLNGDIRIPSYNRLPPAIKEGLRSIARHEKKSMSWVMEEVIIRYFHLRVPQYKRRKNNMKLRKKVAA